MLTFPVGQAEESLTLLMTLVHSSLQFVATKADTRRGTTAPEEEQQQHIAGILTVHMVICHTVRKLLLGLSSGFSPRLRTHPFFSGEFY